MTGLRNLFRSIVREKIKEPQEEMILPRLNARKNQASEHSIPVSPVCDCLWNETELSLIRDIYLFTDALFERTPKKDDTEELCC